MHTGAFSALEALSRIFRVEGVRGLYRGFVPGLFGVSHGAIQFMVYEKLKSHWRRNWSNDGARTPHPVEHILMSSASKLVASVATYPYQVVRSRLQNSHSDLVSISAQGGGARARLSILAFILQLYRSEGALVFFRGLVPNVLRVLPSTCITFVTYEQLNRILSQNKSAGR